MFFSDESEVDEGEDNTVKIKYELLNFSFSEVNFVNFLLQGKMQKWSGPDPVFSFGRTKGLEFVSGRKI